MSNSKETEADRLVAARNTLKIVWVAYRDASDYIDIDDTLVQTALEVALDEIDLHLLSMPDLNLTFEYREGDDR